MHRREAGAKPTRSPLLWRSRSRARLPTHENTMSLQGESVAHSLLKHGSTRSQLGKYMKTWHMIAKGNCQDTLAPSPSPATALSDAGPGMPTESLVGEEEAGCRTLRGGAAEPKPPPRGTPCQSLSPKLTSAPPSSSNSQAQQDELRSCDGAAGWGNRPGRGPQSRVDSCPPSPPRESPPSSASRDCTGHVTSSPSIITPLVMADRGSGTGKEAERDVAADFTGGMPPSSTGLPRLSWRRVAIG